MTAPGVAAEQAGPSAASGSFDLDALASIERRVLWLATRIVDYANRERPAQDGLKVGGHQASSASMVSVMTALYVANLQGADRVSVKPHASPVLHALEYLLGRLDRSYLTRLRDFGGLQSYPSRTKDPFTVDFSTGSVGLGSVAPLFAALADRYVAGHFGARTGGRFISLLGDAELDEGSIWEAIAEPSTRPLDNVLWIVDLNRQSLDRVVPGIRAQELEGHFRLAGWNVVELKYGRRLRSAFAGRGGEVLRRRIDEMPNEQYQSLFGADEDRVRATLLGGLAEPERGQLAALCDEHAGGLRALISDLGGHDLSDILDGLDRAQAGGGAPTVLFAYTIKGYGLEIAGRPQNHSALLDGGQIDAFRSSVGLTPESEWDGFPASSAESELLAAAAARLERSAGAQMRSVPVPHALGTGTVRKVSTQAAFGRQLLEISRHEEIAARLVTVSPDVSVSTNLGGWINKVGVWGLQEDPVYDEMADSPLKWRVGTRGQHIEMGIAEMNLVLLLGQLGLAWDFQRTQLLPIGTLYDPFVMRALEGIVYSTYSGSRFILVGTPAGISLSREGGAHQSINTPGIGIETPGLHYVEPCFALELEWLLLDALARLQDPDGGSFYFRLTTKPVDQEPFARVLAGQGEDALRSDVIAGGYRLREAAGSQADRVVLAACGALVPETLQAADLLAAQEGVDALVLSLSSPDRLYHDWRGSRVEAVEHGRATGTCHLDRLLAPEERNLPLVTVIDGSSHALAWLGSALGTRCVPLGVDRFGQTGSQQSVYAEYGVDAEAIATAALVALEPPASSQSRPRPATTSAF
jgi:pyruvate dehydrogenase E1 component